MSKDKLCSRDVVRTPSDKVQLKESLRTLKESGLTFGDCIGVFGLDTESSLIARVAKEDYGREGEVELDDRTVLSPGEDGVYVLGWLFVPKSFFQKESVEEAIGDTRCSDCKTTDEIVATYCGNFCPGHLKAHVEHCKLCAAEFGQ